MGFVTEERPAPYNKPVLAYPGNIDMVSNDFFTLNEKPTWANSLCIRAWVYDQAMPIAISFPKSDSKGISGHSYNFDCPTKGYPTSGALYNIRIEIKKDVAAQIYHIKFADVGWKGTTSTTYNPASGAGYTAYDIYWCP